MPQSPKELREKIRDYSDDTLYMGLSIEDESLHALLLAEGEPITTLEDAGYTGPDAFARYVRALLDATGRVDEVWSEIHRRLKDPAK